MSNLREQITHLSEKLEPQNIGTSVLHLPLTDIQRDELEHRIALYKAAPSDVTPWEDVRARLFQRTAIPNGK